MTRFLVRAADRETAARELRAALHTIGYTASTASTGVLTVNTVDKQVFCCLLVFTWGDESSSPCRRVADTSRLRCGRPSPLCCSVRCLRGFPPLLWIYVVVSLIPLLLLSVRCSIFFFATFLTSVHGCGCPLALQFALLQFSLEWLLGGGRLHSVRQAIPRIYHSHSERIFPGVRSSILHCQAMGCGGFLGWL